MKKITILLISFFLIQAYNANALITSAKQAILMDVNSGQVLFKKNENEKNLPGSLKDRKPIIGKKIAYKCTGNKCTLPITNWEELVRSLSKD